MRNLNDNRLVKAFTKLRSSASKTLMPFITAGYPDLETTRALLDDFGHRGVKVCELGIPFSDPIADGPTIQASYAEALAGGLTSEKILDLVRSYRADGGQLALVAMVSYSIVYRHDVSQYLAKLAEAGFDGLIVPDLPLEEAATLESLADARSLANVMLIAPTTVRIRQLEIAKHSRGFIYFMSVAGITGERDKLPAETIQAVGELRKHTGTPVCMGFGISKPHHVAEVCKSADGAIVGSAIVHRLNDSRTDSVSKRVAKIGEFVGKLFEPIK